MKKSFQSKLIDSPYEDVIKTIYMRAGGEKKDYIFLFWPPSVAESQHSF
jgi:hypothetical protein